MDLLWMHEPLLSTIPIRSAGKNLPKFWFVWCDSLPTKAVIVAVSMWESICFVFVDSWSSQRGLCSHNCSNEKLQSMPSSTSIATGSVRSIWLWTKQHMHWRIVASGQYFTVEEESCSSGECGDMRIPYSQCCLWSQAIAAPHHINKKN